jgi:hypothetical protein
MSHKRGIQRCLIAPRIKTLRAIERVQAAPSARTLHMLRVVARRVSPLNEARRVRELREALATVA